MRPFGRIPTSLWEEIAALSIEAKALLVYLLSSRHTTMIGCFRLPIAYAMEDLGVSSGTVSEGFKELSRNGFLVRDLEASWVLIPDFLRWNPIENPNQGKAAAKHFENVPPYSNVYAPLIEALKRNRANLPADFLKGLETLPKPYRNIEPEIEPEIEPGAGTGELEPEREPSASRLRANAGDSPSPRTKISPKSAPPANGRPRLQTIPFFDGEPEAARKLLVREKARGTYEALALKTGVKAATLRAFMSKPRPRIGPEIELALANLASRNSSVN